VLTAFTLAVKVETLGQTLALVAVHLKKQTLVNFLLQVLVALAL